MTVGGLKVRVAVAALVAGMTLGACGSPNEGYAFAEEFGSYLDTQEAVVAHDVGGTQPLPYQGEASSAITLDPALDEAQVVEAAATIVAHRPKTDIGSHDVTFFFSADSADADSPVLSFYVQAATPLPDTDKTRDRLTGLVEEAQAWLPADPKITKVTTEAEVVTIETTTEPLEAAPALAEVLAAGERQVRSLEVTSPVGDRVAVEYEGDVTWLAGVQSLVEQARGVAPSVTYLASSAGGDGRATPATPGPVDPPSLTLSLPSDTDEATLAAVRALPAPAGVDVTVFRPKPTAPA